MLLKMITSERKTVHSTLDVHLPVVGHKNPQVGPAALKVRPDRDQDCADCLKPGSALGRQGFFESYSDTFRREDTC